MNNEQKKNFFTKQIIEILIFFLLPFLFQWFFRGNLTVRIIDYLFFLPSITLLYAIHHIIFPRRVIYYLMLLFLLPYDYGTSVYFMISIFAMLAGLLFIFFPILASIFLYIFKKNDQLSAIPDYFTFGIKLTGVSAAIFLVSYLPNIVGVQTITHHNMMAFESTHYVEKEMTPMRVKEYSAVPQLEIKDLLVHYRTWINRPFYKNINIQKSDNHFLITCETLFPAPFSKKLAIFCLKTKDKIILKEALAEGTVKTPIFKLEGESLPDKIKYESETPSFTGNYNPSILTLIPKEMARDSGFTADFLFALNDVKQSAIQLITQDPGENIKIDHFLLYYEDLLKKQYPDFETISKSRKLISGTDGFSIRGKITSGGIEQILIVSVVIKNKFALIILGTTPVADSEGFDSIYEDFIKEIRI